MENFNKLLKEKNKDEIQIFMKNSKIDLLKSIAKRFKLSISAKNKSQIIAIIIQAIQSGKEFKDEPALAQMSVAQLKNKAIELNIDISGLKVKQALRMAILNKMTPSGGVTTTTTATLGSTMQNYDSLKGKSLSYLKALAKQLKIKISKLSKEQLITTILENTSSSGTVPVLENVEIQSDTDLSKLAKNVLLIKATELGFKKDSDKKVISKKDLISFIVSKMPPVQKTSDKPKSKPKTGISFPIQSSELINLKKTLKVVEIKELLKTNNIKIPSGVTKKEDLLPLLLMINKKSTTTTAVVTPVVTTAVVTPTVTTTPTIVESEIDIVSLEDIESPFVPANVNDLTEGPTEDALSEDIIRCLKFYEYPT